MSLEYSFGMYGEACAKEWAVEIVLDAKEDGELEF